MAQRIGMSKAVRAVANANGANSILKVRTNKKKRHIKLFTLSGKKLVELPCCFLNYFQYGTN